MISKRLVFVLEAMLHGPKTKYLEKVTCRSNVGQMLAHTHTYSVSFEKQLAYNYSCSGH